MIDGGMEVVQVVVQYTYLSVNIRIGSIKCHNREWISVILFHRGRWWWGVRGWTCLSS